jgi:hypothetical protein
VILGILCECDEEMLWGGEKYDIISTTCQWMMKLSSCWLLEDGDFEKIMLIHGWCWNGVECKLVLVVDSSIDELLSFVKQICPIFLLNDSRF